MHSNQRGVALITVIMVLLVLTVLGIAASMMMTQEDRTTSRQELQKMALYAAEAGLRRGEIILRASSSGVATSLLSHVAVASTLIVNPAVPVQVVYPSRANWDTAHLGTYLTDPVTKKELANQEVSITTVSGSLSTGKRAFYSLYVRNNPEDVGQNPLQDNDSKIRLVSVAWIAAQDGTGSLWTKILEEEYNWSGTGLGASFQKETNEQATGQVRR